MLNITPIIGMFVSGAIAFGGYSLLIRGNVAQVSELQVEALTALSVTPESDPSIINIASLTTEQSVAVITRPVLVSAEFQAKISVPRRLGSGEKIGFPPLYVMGLMIRCVTERYVDSPSEGA